MIDRRSSVAAIMLLSAHEDAIRTKRTQLTNFLGRCAAGWAWADTHIRTTLGLLRRPLNVSAAFDISLDPANAT